MRGPAAGSKPSREDTGSHDRLELVRPDGRVVVYQGREGRLERTERDGDRNLRNESYNFPSRGVPSLGVHGPGRSTFAWVDLPRNAKSLAKERGHSVRIEALLGKDLRRTQAQEAAR